MSNFLSSAELIGAGFGSLGRSVLVSRDARIYGAENVSLGDHCRIDDFSIVSAAEPVNLGRNVHIATYCALFGRHGITMADFSGLSSRVTIYTASDDYSGRTLTNPTVPDQYKAVNSGPVVLGRHVIIGAGSVILPGVTIGDGSAVGTLSLVSRDISEWTVAVGVPARPVKERSKELLELERSYLETEG